MALSRNEFLKRLTDSGLVSGDAVAGSLAGLPAHGATLSGEQLADELVRLGVLTMFQAEQICLGEGHSLVLGNYVILDKLGQGGMGMVLKARHTRMGRMVAIKVMSPAAVKSPEAVKRFHREVQAAARLTHPNIVIAFDADESNGTHFLVMEYVDGIDLSALVKKRGPLPVELASNCVLQAARGLQFAHEQGVIHRDIKPSNLLIDQKGTVKILDMGLARIEGAVGGSSEGASLTNTGTIMGTVDYMSPEQAMDTKHADARSDIYSLGCSLYYLLTGKAVYDGDTMMKKLMAHQNAPIPTLVAEAASAMAESGVFGHAFDPLFRRMVAKLPEDRPQSMLEVITDLKACRSAGTSVIESFERSGDSYLADLAEQSGPVTRSDPWANTKSDAHSGHDATLISSLDKPRTIRLPVASHRGRLILAATIIFGLIGVVAAIQQVPWHDRNKKDVVADSHLGANSPAEHAADSQTAVPSGWHGWSKEAPAHAATPFNAEQAKRHQREWATHLGTRIESTNSVGARMVFIPPGEFLMGSTEDEIAAGLEILRAANVPTTAFEWSRIPEEGPQHSVVIARPFCLSATEVTVGQFRQFVTASKYLTQGEQFGAGDSNSWSANGVKPEDVKITWRTPGFATTDAHPVTQVTWTDAVEFCNWLSEQEYLEPSYVNSGKFEWTLVPGASGYRLPTEAEWEYACRAGTRTQFSFGDNARQISEFGLTAESHSANVHPVESKLPNPFGLYDMHGNLREWCHDWYSSDYYTQSSQVNPVGPDFGSDRVMRGGRWSSPSLNARSAFRYDIAPFLRNNIGGFRIARAPSPPPTATDVLISSDFEWSPPENLGPAVNGPHSDTNPFISVDGLTLLFSSNRLIGQGGYDLWESHRSSVEEPFQPAVNLPRVVNSFGADDSPCLSSDGLQLVFASDRPGSEGGYDLYLCRRDDPQSKWGPPENLKTPINTSGREESPSFSPDGLTLYFISNREGGQGGTDVWYSRRKNLAASFGEPENPGPLVNSSDNEIKFTPIADGRAAILCRGTNEKPSHWLSVRHPSEPSFAKFRNLLNFADGDTGAGSLSVSKEGRSIYFRSKRSGGQGDDDLWQVHRRLKPTKNE